MKNFLTPLIIKDNGDYTFTLVEGFRYQTGGEFGRISIHVPKGYITDFASIPRIFWSILPPHGPWGKAAVIHDYLYKLVRKNKFDRGVADAIFKEAMTELNVHWINKWILYLSVRMFGWIFAKKTPIHHKTLLSI